MDKFMQAAIYETRQGFAEYGIPVGPLQLLDGVIIGSKRWKK
jgi:hypothetical protein